MGPKPTPSKKGNTLFSYFSKSPASSKPKPTDNEHSDVLSPKRSPNKCSPAEKVSGNHDKNSTNLLNAASKESTDSGENPGDLVWAKLEGYPWWPSLVCNHPTSNTHFKSDKRGKNPQTHVQFFDEPTSRAWIKNKYIKAFSGADNDFKKGSPYYSFNKDVEKGVIQANNAMKLTLEDRLNLVVELQPSEDDDDDDMDLDPDIFDDEMEETDNSKENEDVELSPKKTPAKCSPGKSPAKFRKSARKPKPKRRRIVESHSGDEDSEEEFKPHSESESDDASSGVDENDVSDIESESEIDSPVKKPVNDRKRKRPQSKTNSTPWRPSKESHSGTNTKEKEESPKSKTSPPSAEMSFSKSSFTPSVGEKTKSKLAMFSATDVESTGGLKGAEQEANFPHLKLEFLQPEKIKDANGKKKSDPDYDPKTLYVPETFKNNQTPAMRQWWELKSQLFDSVLFFKMGKFYELFHMDAVVAVNELGLIYMKGEHAHSGFPEIAYNRYADNLIQKGYKVARIEQTETPEMMQERVKHMSRTATKFDKVVKREVCRITTQGTKTLNFLDGDCSEAQSSYLLAIAEKEENTEGCSSYGVCFVDTSIGKFNIGQFQDDRHCSRLRTMLAHCTPVQILTEKGKLTEKTQLVMDNNLRTVIRDQLRPGTEFWDSTKTLKVLTEEEYFREKSDEDIVWPECLKKMLSDNDSLGLTAAEEYTLALRALGAIIWYLQYTLLDQEILSMKNFEEYIPLDSQTVSEKKQSQGFTAKQHMVLDGVTLANLDILENSVTGTQDGTLLHRLDQCSTPFGKRLFRQWLCAPLCNHLAIADRLDGLDDLSAIPDTVSEVTDILRKLPDLERILGRIHCLGTNRNKNRPDSRAIFFDEAKYSKKKIEDFLLTLDGFKMSYKIAKKMKEHVCKFKSKLLQRTTALDSAEENAGNFPDLKEELKFFDEAFNHEKAKKEGVIVPNKGVDPDYDEAKLDIERTEGALNDYLTQQKTRLGCKNLVYWGSGKNRYQIEVPESVLKRVPDEYELMSSKKGWKRYRTKQIEKKLADLTDAEERKDMALKDTMRRIFHSFDERYSRWSAALQCLSVLDVMISLSKYRQTADGEVCRPEIVAIENDTEPFIQIHEATHPCVTRTFGGGDFIPNNTFIGVPDDTEMETEDNVENPNSKVVLVTGPNMGGKSTLMRQVGLLTIMAQMGCYVPAEKCRLTPVDRIFTRLGASDRIMAGESTFFVELSETSAILQHSTKHSLVLMDELGRGTATYDGTAIACAVVEELSRRVQCRTLFSTHYHSLVEEFSKDPNIRLGHMACMVENEDKEDPSQETITFLYKFIKGACPKSYGFNAARLANLPEDVIKAAIQKSQEFEATVNRVKVLKSLWKPKIPDNLKDLVQQVKIS